MLVRRLLVPVGAALALLLALLAGPAAAHVTVQAPGAQPGGFTKLTFRTPTERDVPTTQLEIAFPEDHPIARVSVKPHPGWMYQVTKAAPAEPFEVFGEPVEEVVTRITWTADPGNGIGPGEFDEFEVSAGPLPEAERLVFKALQTYDDGEVVRWIEEPVEGGERPEHPAPVLELAPQDEQDASGHAAESPEPQSQASPSDGDADADADTATALGAVGLGAGLLGMLLGGLALLRTRRSA
jgi:uncharacterized protein YcnI